MSTATARIPVALSKDDRRRLEELAAECSLPIATIARILIERGLQTIPNERGGPWLFAVAELEDYHRGVEVLAELRERHGTVPMMDEGTEALLHKSAAQEAPIGPSVDAAEQGTPKGRSAKRRVGSR